MMTLKYGAAIVLSLVGASFVSAQSNSQVQADPLMKTLEPKAGTKKPVEEASSRNVAPKQLQSSVQQDPLMHGLEKEKEVKTAANVVSTSNTKLVEAKTSKPQATPHNQDVKNKDSKVQGDLLLQNVRNK